MTSFVAGLITIEYSFGNIQSFEDSENIPILCGSGRGVA
jgi:hypothetical protein